MIKEISKNIVYVDGYKNSAIYNFNDEKVYSLNNFGTEIFRKYFRNINLSMEENEFVSKVKQLLNINVIRKNDYKFKENNDISVNTAWLEVTQRCTHKCLHCYEGKEHCEPKSVLEIQQWMNSIYELKKLKCDNIQFIGGEPTLYPYLSELIEYSKKLNIKNISIFSNLFFLNKRLLNTIIKYKIKVNFSLYGHDSVTHDKITNIPGSFKKIEENLKILLDNKVPVSAHIIIMKENENEKEKIFRYVNKLGISDIKYDEVRKVFGGNQELHLVKKSDLIRKGPNFKASKVYFDNSYNKNTCWHGKCVISTDGNVYPCEFERNIIYGNINECSLSNIIKGEIIKKYWNMSFDEVDYCKQCEYRFACKDCRPLAFAEKGDIYQKNPRCKYNPMLGKWED